MIIITPVDQRFRLIILAHAMRQRDGSKNCVWKLESTTVLASCFLHNDFDNSFSFPNSISQKDNVSVLANTKTYLNSLKARLSELEERNQMLERQLKSADDADEVSDRSERVEVQISRSSEFKSEAQQINLSLIVREECDMIDLVLHALRLLKEMRDVILISMDASTRSPSRNIFARANLKLQVKVRALTNPSLF